MEGHTCIRPRAIAQRRKRTECSASFTLCMRWLSLLIKLVRRACMWSVPSRLIRGCSFTAKKWVLRMEVSAIICRCVWKGYRKIWFLQAGVSIIMKNEMGSIIARMSPKGSQQRPRSCQQIPKWCLEGDKLARRSPNDCLRVRAESVPTFWFLQKLFLTSAKEEQQIESVCVAAFVAKNRMF